MKLTYDNVGKTEEPKPVKTLPISNNPTVLCPFTKHYTSVERCKGCNNFAHEPSNFKLPLTVVKCKWPY